MEIHLNSPVLRFKGLPRAEPVVKDNTAIMMYKLCALKYFFRMVLGFTSPDTQPYFAFGKAIHKYREILEVEYLNNLSSPDFKSKEILFDFCHVIALKAAIDTWNKDTNSKVQVGTKWDFLTVERLKKTCNKMKEWWVKEKTIGNIHVIATEQPFTIVLQDEYGNQWIIGGRFDQIIKWNTRLWGRDFKTSSKPDMFFSRSLFPNHQFILYTYSESELHGEQVQGQLIEMIFNDKTKGPEVYNHPVSFTSDQIKNWKVDLFEWLRRIDISRKNDHYPMNENHCNFCEYHGVCKVANENGMMNFLKNNYKHEPWDYTSIRD